MKKFFFLIAVLFLSAGSSFAQCGDELMKQALGAMGSYQYIKDFDIKLSAGTSKVGSSSLSSLTAEPTIRLTSPMALATQRTLLWRFMMVTS